MNNRPSRMRGSSRVCKSAGAGALIALSLLSAACSASAAVPAGNAVDSSGSSAPSTAAAGPTTTAAATAATTVSWHTVLTGPAVTAGQTARYSASAVVATGPTAGWAFVSGAAYAYQRTGPASWKKVPLPGGGSGTVNAAAATSPSNVWAVYNTVSGARLLHWTGRQWTVARTFPGEIGQLSVLGPHDVWVFGGLKNNRGVWHYDGRGWTQPASTFSGGYARTDSDVWAYTGQSVAHFDGTRWTTTSLATLMPVAPKGAALKFPPAVTGVIALAPGSVYVTASGNEMPQGGPLAVLHYNGRGWTRVAQGKFIGTVWQQLTPDGTGGLWLPASNGDGNPLLLHYAAGRLTGVNLPSGSVTTPTFAFSVSRIPGTSEVLGAGVRYLEGNAKTAPVVLQSW